MTIKRDTLLSIIVPVVKPELHLERLIDSFYGFNNQQVEMIIINQSQKELNNSIKEKIKISTIDYLTNELLPAANARNLGASIANGKYLFFLDDDALLYSGAGSLTELLCILTSDVDVVVGQRGELNEGKFVSHWYNDLRKITHGNFPRYIIEWNLIIGKRLFSLLGGFPEIGTGSRHAALSGEVFVLFAKILNGKHKVQLLPTLQIAHPSLFRSQGNTKKILGYAYGAGYAVGLSFDFLSFYWKTYWFSRVILSCVADLLFRYKNYPVKNINISKYRVSLAKCRLAGFYDALIKKTQRPLNWIEKENSGLEHIED